MSMTLGWRSDLEPRTELHRTAATYKISKPYRAPEEIDPRSWLRTEDQLRISACAGNALALCAELVYWFLTGGEVIQFSRFFSYLVGQKEAGLLGSDQGCTINGVVRGAKNYGLCLESTMPYPRSYHSSIPQDALREAIDRQLLQHAVLRNYNDVFEWLATGVGAVIIGIPWRESLASNRTGVINDASGDTYGGHAVGIVGYSKRKDSRGRKFPFMGNSHGTGWGDNGYAEVNPALFDAWGADSYCEMIGITGLENIEPQNLSWIGMFN